MGYTNPFDPQRLEKEGIPSPREPGKILERAKQRLQYIQENPNAAREVEIQTKVELLGSLSKEIPELYGRLSERKKAADGTPLPPNPEEDAKIKEELEKKLTQLGELNDELHSIRLAVFAKVQAENYGKLPENIAKAFEGFGEKNAVAEKMVKYAKALTVNTQELLEKNSEARKQNMFYNVTKEGFLIDGIALFDAQKEVRSAMHALQDGNQKAVLQELEQGLASLENNADPGAKATLLYHRYVVPGSNPEGTRLLKMAGMGFAFFVAGYSFLKSLVIDPLVFKKDAEIPKDWPTWMWLGIGIALKNPSIFQSKFEDSLKTFKNLSDPESNRLLTNSKMNKETIEEFFELRKNGADNKNFRKLLDESEKKDTITDVELVSAVPATSKLYISLKEMDPKDRCKLVKILAKIPKNQEEAAKAYVVERKNQEELKNTAKKTIGKAQENSAQEAGTQEGNH